MKILNKDLEKLNSITKYPSIYTYHKLGNRGKLEEELLCTVDENITGYVTEKLDGTNTRIIIHRDDFIIGSREQLLYAKGDRIINASMHIVDTLIGIASSIKNNIDINSQDDIIVIYGEVYGKNIGRASKNYSKGSNAGYRVFDVATFSKNDFLELVDKDLSSISTWRENGGQSFLIESELREFCREHELERVPHIDSVDIKNLPKSISGMYDYLLNFKDTRAGLDNKGIAEGIVIRSNDRKYIRKIRLEEYKKTLGVK